jgi:hypothetical protein
VEDSAEESIEKPILLTPEDKSQLVGFFALLIKVDKRINPHLYQSSPRKND